MEKREKRGSIRIKTEGDNKMKILCSRCSRPVAFSTGKLVQIKRSDNIFSIYGKDFSILASCAGHCGYQNAIIVKDGELVIKDLNIEKIGGEDGRRFEIKNDGSGANEPRKPEGRIEGGSEKGDDRGTESGTEEARKKDEKSGGGKRGRRTASRGKERESESTSDKE